MAFGNPIIAGKDFAKISLCLLCDMTIASHTTGRSCFDDPLEI